MKIISPEYIKKIMSIQYPHDMMKIVVYTNEICNNAKIVIKGYEFREKHNYIEPFERKAHVFFVPCAFVTEKTPITFIFSNCNKKSELFENFGDVGIIETCFDPSCEVDYETAFAEDDSKIQIQKVDKTVLSDGVVSKTYTCINKNNAPVKMFALFVDPCKATMFVGTPDNDYKAGNCSQTVQGEIDAAVRDGIDVIAATNADFFDMHDTCMPSGIVVKNGVIVANADSDRPFFGIKKNGMPVITTQYEAPGIADELYSAVCGREIIMKDGKPADLALVEPFGTTRHPRTCVGIKPDNTFIILVVDGRIPDYSNGASLTDLYLVLKELGAVEAINVDGGGSSTMIIKKDDGSFEMINHPADLHRPFDNLIRDVYNSMLIIKK